MQLTYRGYAYYPNNNQFETIASEYTACFRGQSYTPRRPVQTSNSQLGLRKYRGVAYGAKV